MSATGILVRGFDRAPPSVSLTIDVPGEPTVVVESQYTQSRYEGSVFVFDGSRRSELERLLRSLKDAGHLALAGGQRPAWALDLGDAPCGDGQTCSVWPERCRSCARELPRVYRSELCQCGTPIPAPNLLEACRREQRQALDEAFTRSTSSWSAAVKVRWRTLMLKSAAVLSCRSEVLLSVLWGVTKFQNYLDQVASGNRLPDGPEWDYPRYVADTDLFPGYQDKIRFAAVSLDGRGVRRYGRCFVELRDDVVRAKASVFVGNSLFSQQANDARPDGRGKRAAWLHRDLLAVAKLAPHLRDDLSDAAVALLLLNDGNTPPDDVFVEVHLFGAIGAEAISRVSVGASEPPRRRDEIEAACHENKIPFEVRA